MLLAFYAFRRVSCLIDGVYICRSYMYVGEAVDAR
jgi:hypothetical protein